MNGLTPLVVVMLEYLNRHALTTEVVETTDYEAALEFRGFSARARGL